MKNIDIIPVEELLTTFPKNTNFNIQELNNDQLECYLQMYTLYRELLSKYFIEVLNLNKYDQMFKEKEYQTIGRNLMDVYQKFNCKKLDYFYIRNNIYLERLSKSEFDFLYQKLCQEDKFNIDEYTINFLEKTYPKIIFEDVLRDGNIVNTNYGPEIPDFLIPNNSIVIGFRYDIYDNHTHLNDKEWNERFLKQQDYINELFKQMQNDLKNKVNLPINILQYDKYSIKKIPRLHKTEQKR